MWNPFKTFAKKPDSKIDPKDSLVYCNIYYYILKLAYTAIDEWVKDGIISCPMDYTDNPEAWVTELKKFSAMCRKAFDHDYTQEKEEKEYITNFLSTRLFDLWN